MTLVWILIFVSDWIMNYNGARLYYQNVKGIITYEDGDNLRPISMEEMRRPLWLLLRFISELTISSSGIWLLLSVCKLYSSDRYYEIVCGFFILLEACIHFRHLGNVALFSSFRKNSGIRGAISFPNYVMLKAASVDYLIFAVAFFFLFALNGINFALGGAISCLGASIFNGLHAIVSRLEMLGRIGRA